MIEKPLFLTNEQFDDVLHYQKYYLDREMTDTEMRIFKQGWKYGWCSALNKE